ncbi:MAG TPA: hypothetical protein VMT89_13130, partial [Candidatus Acidoferrales bacterium]|nr:hypothetical protein [Candidatus Acidoferrales bacterium]
AEIKPGSYTMTISRGPEYSIRKLSPDPVVISAGATTDVGIQTIKRVVDTTGYLSADFHIHSGRSLDSSAPLENRVRSFAGEGLEVMVSTDHDINTDYQPIIKKVGMQPFITSIIGTEVTTSVPRPPYLANGWGHINSWPSVYDANQRRGGSVEDEEVSANVIFDRLRAQSNMQCVGGAKNGLACTGNSQCGGKPCTDVGEQVVQLNHPRAGLGGVVNIGILDNIGYDPAVDIGDCQKYPVTCSSSKCNGGTNDGTSCTTDGDCTGGGKCGCTGGSTPGAANGCNNILNDLNVIPQATLCTTPGCGSGFEGANGTRNIDADVMEIDNSGTRGGYGNLKLVRRDWLSLLNQGIEVGKSGSQHPLWGSGVSDSHRLVVEVPGYSRTYVGAGELPTTTPIDTKSFNQQVLGGNMSVSSGPYVTVKANLGGPDVGMGGLLTGTSNVNLKIKVQAPPWVPVDEVRIIQNGCVVACYNSTTTPAVSTNPADPYDQTTTSVVRFDTTSSPISLPQTEDSYFIVEASPNLPLSGKPAEDAVVNSVAEDVFPYGFTNPIFTDFDSSGGYEGISLPPGAGEPTCPALPLSCSAGAGIASAPHLTMFAKATKPAEPKNFFARVFNRFVGTAQADDDRPQKRTDDSDRVRQLEQELHKPNPEHAPWNRIEFPTPAPTPAEQH